MYPTNSLAMIWMMFSCLSFLILGLSAYRFRTLPGGKYFIVSMLLISLNSMVSIAELTADSFNLKLWFRNLQQIPLFFTPVIFLGLVLDFTGFHQPKAKKYIHLALLPVYTYLLLIFTDSVHHLMRIGVTLESFGSMERIRVQSTALSMLFMMYVQMVALASLLILLLAFRRVSRFYRGQYFYVFLGILIPFAMKFIAPHMNLPLNSSLLTIPSSLLLFYALFKYKLLYVRPLAKDKVFEVIKDGIVILQSNGMIIDTNPAGMHILHKIAGAPKSDSYIGKNAASVFHKNEALNHLIQSEAEGEIRMVIGLSHYSVQAIPYSRGKLLLFSDITKQVHYEHDLLQRASMDGLTKVYNRQYLMELANQLSQADSVFSFVLIDLDYFKQINDTFGHQTGDIVLADCAKVIKETVSDTGIVGRLGGEEFGILLPNIRKEEALKLAEMIRMKVHTIDFLEDSRLHITISIGLTVNDRGIPFREVYRRTDEALYLSKRNGRNQVTFQH